VKKRAIRMAVSVLAICAVALTAGAVTPAKHAALPAAIPGCQERSVGNAGQDWIYWSWEMMGHTTGSFRVSSGCSHQIKFWSQGWRFEGNACGDMRVRLLTANGATLRRTAWTPVCGGSETGHTYTLASFLPTNQRFELEGRARDVGDRRQAWWWMGVFRF
jgi:hypothetical protein